VLFIGGPALPNQILKTVTRSDPSTDTFTPAADTTVGRFLPATIVLPDGRVAGGYSQTTGSADLTSAEVYDPAIDHWTPAHAHGAAQEPDVHRHAERALDAVDHAARLEAPQETALHGQVGVEGSGSVARTSSGSVRRARA
jgi:hypothetical protein